MLENQEEVTKEVTSTDIVKPEPSGKSLLDKLNDNLNSSTETLVEKIIDETDADELQDLTKLFNINQIKKNIIRTQQMNNLLDTVTGEVLKRLSNSPYAFDNGELIDYMKVLQGNLEKTQNAVKQVPETPMIQINQQNNTTNNIVVDKSGASLNRDSREKIIDIVQAIINDTVATTESELDELEQEDE